jgi:hypothetical protein
VKQKIELSGYDAERVIPGNRRNRDQLPSDFIKVLLCLGLSFPVVSHSYVYHFHRVGALPCFESDGT